jgi:carboxypeptidase Taq
MTPSQAYEELIRRWREAGLLASCLAVLGWDEETYLPPGGVEHRAAQTALLTGLHHERVADPRLGDLLDAVAGSDLVADPLSPEAVNVREVRRQHERVRRVTRRLAEEIARVATLAQQAWAKARQHDDYSHFRPWLGLVAALKREEASALGGGQAPYDALLEDYEPGLRASDVADLFAALRPPLAALTAELAASGRRAPVGLLRGDFPKERQRDLNELAAAAVGFDFRAGRLDEAAHPSCCAVGPGDCRITTRYRPDRLDDALFSTLHEVGHALYEQGLDAAHHGTPFGEAPSVALHESQARLWENAVGRSRPFWEHLLPAARRLFPAALGRVGVDDITAAVQHVAPTPVRVQADEVTYNLHVLIRFELEQALLSGDLSAADLPGAWDDAYRRDLGVTPASAAEGCLQDGHWAAGLFGYFPTYTLGNVFAAQLFLKACEDLGDLDRQMARGDFGGLLGWLRRHVYGQGGRFTAAGLVERATGAAPSPGPLLRALRQKYGG